MAAELRAVPASKHVERESSSRGANDGVLPFSHQVRECSRDFLQGVPNTKFRYRLKLEASCLEAIGSTEVEKVLKSAGDVSGWLRVAPSGERA